MKINVVSFLPESDETRTMHAKSDNIEIMMSSETEEVIKELLKSRWKRYEKKIEKSMK